MLTPSLIQSISRLRPFPCCKVEEFTIGWIERIGSESPLDEDFSIHQHRCTRVDSAYSHISSRFPFLLKRGRREVTPCYISYHCSCNKTDNTNKGCTT